MGLHARPAGKLVKAAKAMDSTVMITKDGSKPASAKKLMSVVGLGARTGETVTVVIEHGNEEANAAVLERLFRENL